MQVIVTTAIPFGGDYRRRIDAGSEVTVVVSVDDGNLECCSNQLEQLTSLDTGCHTWLTVLLTTTAVGRKHDGRSQPRQSTRSVHDPNP